MDQQKSSSSAITKRAQITLLVFCTLSSIIFILIHLIVLAKKGEVILSFFLEKEHDSSSPSEIIDYFKWYTKSTCKKEVYFGGPLLFQRPSRKLTLVEGQKAVCFDEKVAPQINNCLVYSFGIHDDWHFEKGMEEHQGCNVYTFDYSINMGHHDHSKGIHFYPIALGSKNKAKSKHKPWETKTLTSIYEMMSPFHGENTTIDYLKIDLLEDLAALTQIIDSGFLKRVRQLSLKIIVPIEMEENQEYLIKISKVLQRIGNEGEMIRFSSRVDYFSNRKLNGKMTSYSAYELAWFNFGKLYWERSSLPKNHGIDS